MKVLRIYDHLGELKKEFNIYVEGADFKWEASYPEVIWFGAVILEEAGKEPEKPSETLSELLMPEPEVLERADQMRALISEPGPEPEPEVVEEETEEDKQVKADSARKEREIRAMEVKDEPEKVHRKRSRVKRSASSASPESTEGLPQNDSPGDTPEGN